MALHVSQCFPTTATAVVRGLSTLSDRIAVTIKLLAK